MKKKVEIHLDIAVNAVVTTTCRPGGGDNGVTLEVTRKEDADGWYLDVNDEDEMNWIERHPDTQVVKWKLTGDAANGTFNEITDRKAPGFKWIDGNPPAGVFSAPRKSTKGREILIDDLNDCDDAIGAWYYQLSATIDKKLYQSRKERFPPSPNVTTNASIKNK